MIEPAPPRASSAFEQHSLRTKQRRRVVTAALVEEKLEHELRAEVSDVLTGAPRQRRKAVRPRLVAASIVRAGPSSLAVVPLASTSPLSRSPPSARYTSGRVHEEICPISPADARSPAIAQPWRADSQSSPSAAHSARDGSMRGDRLIATD